MTYVNVGYDPDSFISLHWIVGLYYYDILVNEGIGGILVIQTFYPSTLSVLYNKEVYPTSLLYYPLLFLLIYLNQIRLHKTLSYCSYSRYFFYFTDIKIYRYLCTLLCVYILLLLQ